MTLSDAKLVGARSRRLVCYAVVCLALTSSAVLRSQEILRNSDIVTMTTARLSAETIILKIETSATQFDTSKDALDVLRAVGVVDSVIAAMIKAGPSKPAAAPAPPPPPAPRPPAKVGGKPLILVQPFAVASSVSWPYEPKQLQTQTVLILLTKDRIKERFDVATTADDAAGPVYTLHGEVTAWKAGNRATRMLVGLGAGRESADIRYWLTDQKGTKVFDREDTIRSAFLGSAFAASVGELAEPFAAKLAERLEDLKLPDR